MRKKIIAANWKMNMTNSETEAFIETFLLEIADVKNVEMVIVPPFTAIGKASECLSDSQTVKLGAQNMYPEHSGAFTGEVSAAMLRELYCRYIVIGHSERRTLFGETDAFINKKVIATIDAQITPILCVGETLEERDAGKVEEVLKTQLEGGLAGVAAADVANLVVAYEPVWAIGTGRTATPEQAQEAHAFIRSVLAGIADEATAQKVRIQYGGSMKAGNAAELVSQPDIDGGLVGGAALDPRTFAELIKAASSVED